MTNKGNGYKFQAIQERRTGKKSFEIYQLKKDGTQYAKPNKMVIKSDPQEEIARLEELNPGKKFIAVFK